MQVQGLETTAQPNPAGAALNAQSDSFRTKVLGRIGAIDVRLARDEDEIDAAQQMRHRIFFGAGDSGLASALRDRDRFDNVCDHLLVLDTTAPGTDRDRIVGTYRLLRQDQAARAGGFYSDGEFEFGRLVARHPDKRFLELGRSCVLPAYRGKRTIEVLWQGIWAYVLHHRIDVMAGCASFPGISPAEHAQALSFLARTCRVAPEFAVRANAQRYHPMDLIPAEAIDARAALAGMPPLLKGYLRLGARIGDGCVIDAEFGSVDVCVVLPVAAITDRYIQHYSPDAQRFAA